jgi:hypothetical protein
MIVDLSRELLWPLPQYTKARVSLILPLCIAFSHQQVHHSCDPFRGERPPCARLSCACACSVESTYRLVSEIGPLVRHQRVCAGGLHVSQQHVFPQPQLLVARGQRWLQREHGREGPVARRYVRCGCLCLHHCCLLQCTVNLTHAHSHAYARAQLPLRFTKETWARTCFELCVSASVRS